MTPPLRDGVPPIPRGRLPSSVRSADGERKATFARLRDGSGYYVSFYSLDRVGTPRFSTATPCGVLSKAAAYLAAYAWVTP